MATLPAPHEPLPSVRASKQARAAFAASLAAIAAFFGGAAFGEYTLACHIHPTTALTNTQLRSPLLYGEKHALLNVEEMIHRRYPHTIPTPSQALALIRRSGDFVKVGYSSSMGDAAGSSKDTVDVDSNSAPGTLDFYAPDPDSYGTTEMQLSAGKAATFSRLHENGWLLAALVVSSIIGVLTLLGTLAGVIPALSAGLLKGSRRRAAWRQLVWSPLLGPDQYEDGYQILRAEVQTGKDGSVRFVAAQYMFDSYDADWTSYGHKALNGWDRPFEGADTERVADRWFDFCNDVARQNTAAWQKMKRLREPKLALPESTDSPEKLASLPLQSEREIVDLQAIAAEHS